MEGQETDVGHQPQEQPNPFLSVSHYHHKGETKAPGPMLLVALPTCSPTSDSGTADPDRPRQQTLGSHNRTAL